MPEIVQQNALDQQTQKQTLPAPNVDGMSLSELESFVKGEPAITPPPPVNDLAAVQQPVPVEGGEKKWIEIKDEESGIDLRFSDQQEVEKSLLHAQKLIRNQKETLDRMNAERGELGQFRDAYEEAQQKNEQLANYIAELEDARQQLQAGQSPVAGAPNPLAALTVQPGQDQSQALYNEVARLNSALMEGQTQIAELRDNFTQVVGGLQQREQEVVIDQGVQGLYSEVSNFSQKHPEFQTSKSFEQLDDIVSTYGEEVAKAMISPDDFEKYEKTMELVGLLKNDENGEFDLSRKNYSNLDEAFVLQQYRSGTLGNAIAEAHKAGVANLEQALNRSAQSATVLPNNLISRTGNDVQMGPAEIDSILNMDPAVVNANPELRKQFDNAIKSLGINKNAMG